MMEILFLHEAILIASDKKTCLLFQRVKTPTVQLMLMVLFLQLPDDPLPLAQHSHHYEIEAVIKKRLKNCTSKVAENLS